MKRKIDTIKGKRLVTGGGINTLNKNEILVETKGDTITLKERDGSGNIKQLSGSNENSSSDMEYYSINEEKSYNLGDEALVMISSFSLFKYTLKFPSEAKRKYINGGWAFYNFISEESATTHLHAIGFTKIMGVDYTYNTLIELYKDLGFDISLFDSIFTPITKEEFYDLNNI